MPRSVESETMGGVHRGRAGACGGNQSASLDVSSHPELCGRGASAPVPCLRALGRLLPGQGGRSWGDKDLGPIQGLSFLDTLRVCRSRDPIAAEPRGFSQSRARRASASGRPARKGFVAVWSRSQTALSLLIPFEAHIILSSWPYRHRQGQDLGQGVPPLGKVLVGSREPGVGLPGPGLLSLLPVEPAAGDPSRWFQEKAPPVPLPGSESQKLGLQGCASDSSSWCPRGSLSQATVVLQELRLLHRPSGDSVALTKVSGPHLPRFQW